MCMSCAAQINVMLDLTTPAVLRANGSDKITITIPAQFSWETGRTSTKRQYIQTT